MFYFVIEIGIMANEMEHPVTLHREKRYVHVCMNAYKGRLCKKICKGTGIARCVETRCVCVLL